MKAETIGVVAKASGVSVRTIRYYESLGLLSLHRLENGHRVFTNRALLQLNRILLLKRLGLPLDEISKLLEASQIDARATLTLQKQLLEGSVIKLRTQIDLISTLLSIDDLEHDVDADRLCKLIKTGEMTVTQEQWQKVYDQFYSKAEQEAWIKFKSGISPDDMKAAEIAWPKLIQKVEGLLDTDPKGPKAQEALREWQALIAIFEPADELLKAGMNRIYDNLDDWPADGPEKPFSKAVWDFIQRAAS